MNPLVSKALTRNCPNVASALSSLNPCSPLAQGTPCAQLSPGDPGRGGLTLATSGTRQSLSLALSLSLSLEICTHITQMRILKQFLAMLIL